jgi:AraC family transcriptional regulator of arabinose operon
MDNPNRKSNALWPDYIKFGFIEYPPGSVLGPRIQHTYEFVFVHSGSICLRVDDVSYHINNNTVKLMFPGHTEFYQFSKTEKTTHSFLHLSFSFMPKSLVAKLYNLPKFIPISKQMEKLIDYMGFLDNCNHSTAEEVQKSIALSIFWLFLGEAESSESQKEPPNSIIDDACRHIVSNLNKEITLTSISQAINISRGHLIRLYKSELNTTPMKYVWQRRTARGIDLLIHSGLLIKEIANRCGFKTQNHFSRKILEATGHSPRNLRKINWQKNENLLVE